MKDMNTMHQQINLFQPVFRKQQKVFSATTLAQIAAAVLLLLIAILGHARWALGSMARSAEALQQQHDHILNQIGALEAAYQTPDTKSLDTEIEQLMANIDQRNNLLMQFDQLMIQHRSGFAGQFKALAEQHIPGLWLEGVSVNGDGEMEIRGTSLDAKLVPVYLQHLQKQQNLSATPFETVSMQRSAEDKPQIQFVLRNHKGEMSWQ
ncbi:MAG: PilN domain-containing protein [Thiogranum sp.]